MAIVSISESARLTGKARSTIQTYLKTGKLSKTTDNHTGATGVDTSELIRVFGYISKKTTTENTCSNNVVKSQHTTGSTLQNTADHVEEIVVLKAENAKLKAVLEAKQETIDGLNRALLLLEACREEKTEMIQTQTEFQGEHHVNNEALQEKKSLLKVFKNWFKR